MHGQEVRQVPFGDQKIDFPFLTLNFDLSAVCCVGMIPWCAVIFLSFHVGDLIEQSHFATMLARDGMVLIIAASTFFASAC